jgi:curved DNA-binding protein CbpA
MEKDPYVFLGLRHDASKDDMKKRYLELVKLWHPDTCHLKDQRSRREAEAQFKEIQRAYSWVSKKHMSPGRFRNEYVGAQLKFSDC